MAVYRVEYTAPGSEVPVYVNQNTDGFDAVGWQWPSMEAARKAKDAMAAQLKKKGLPAKYLKIRITKAEDLPQPEYQDPSAEGSLDAVMETALSSDISEETTGDFYEALSDVSAVVDNIDHVLEECEAVIRVEDLRVSDYLHYIEMNTVNAAQAAHLIKQIRESRIRRRQAKNLKAVLDALKPARENILKSRKQADLANGEPGRLYHPRIETGLFSPKNH